jgi:hypothetical protein
MTIKDIPQDGQYPDEQTADERSRDGVRRTIVTNSHVARNQLGEEVHLGADIQVHVVTHDGQELIETKTVHRSLDDGQILREEDIERLGRCQAVVLTQEGPMLCNASVLVYRCRQCNKAVCALHSRRIPFEQVLTLDIIKELKKTPLRFQDKFLDIEYICINCLEEQQVLLQQQEKMLRRARIFSAIKNFITAGFSDDDA